jgi:hypothetical protein
MLELLAAASIGFAANGAAHADGSLNAPNAEYLHGDELVAFALHQQHSFAIDPGGTFAIKSGYLQVTWSDTVEGDIELRGDEMCIKTEKNIERCYAISISPPQLAELGCVYMVVSVQEKRVGCLRDR